MKLSIIDIWTRLRVKLNKTIAAGISNGVMQFGDNNDYPQVTERLINASVTARSCSRILRSFIVGHGFNPEVNNIVVGYDLRGREVTVMKLMTLLAGDIAKHNGCYVHVAQNVVGAIKELTYVPFKNCRFGKVDDLGYTSYIHVYDNWEKTAKFEREKIRVYPIYSPNLTVFAKRVEAAGGIERFGGQIDFFFNEDEYLYPLSQIDSVFHDVDAEFGVGQLRDNIFRNGMLEKVIFRVSPQPDDRARDELKEALRQLVSSDGDPVMIIEDDVDETGVISDRNFKIDKIPNAITPEIFEKLEPLLVNRIRKAFFAIPQILIEYDESKMGTTSGEALTQAVNYYNAITSELRTNFQNWIVGLLQEFDNPTLQANNDWTIKPLQL